EPEAERALVRSRLVRPHDFAACLDGHPVLRVPEAALEPAADLRQEGGPEPDAPCAQIPRVGFETARELVVAELDGDARERDPRVPRIAPFDAFHSEPPSGVRPLSRSQTENPRARPIFDRATLP